MKELVAIAEQVAEKLKAKRQTIAVAESSAGGLISAALLAVPGASAYFLGSAVVYTGEARRLLADNQPIPKDLRYLGGITQLRYILVYPEEGDALRLRRVAVERHHRDALGDGVVDGGRDFRSVGTRDQHGVGAFVHRLRDALRLRLAVLLGRGQPCDFDP